MNEYINKTKLLTQLNQELSEISTTHHDHIDLEKQMYEFAIKKIEEMECDDVEVVKRGHWITKPNLMSMRCSECKGVFSDFTLDYYCPACGAKMDYRITTNNDKPIKYICDDSKVESDDEGNITITRKMSPTEIAETFDVPLNDVLNGKARLGLCIEK